MKINGKPDGGGGGGVITSLSITSNGTYTAGAGVDGYSPVDVDVQPVLESLSVSANGTYTPSVGTDGYSQVSVEVVPPLQGKSVTVNGLVTPDEGYYGLSQVDVSVPIPTPVTTVLSVSANNTYYPAQGVDGFSKVIVDVPQSVAGFTEKEITEETYAIYNLSNSASFVHRNVFEADLNLLTVNLPNASYVGIEAFKMCSNLTRVDMATCTFIYDQGFSLCTSLSQVSMPELGSVQTAAFANCSSLEFVNFPKLSSTNGGSIFNACRNISYASLPEMVRLTDGFFGGCSNMTSVYIPKCEYTQRDTFNGCWTLQDVDMTKFISVGNGTFANCRMLSQAILTNCISFGTGVFTNCSVFELLSFGNNYPRFSYNNTLTNTKIASGSGSIYVPSYNYSWYITANGWSSLASRFVSYEVESVPLNYSDGVIYGNTSYLDYDCSTYLGIAYTVVTEINLPECYSIVTNGDRPFKACTNIQSLTLGVVSVNSGFMDRRSKLQTLNLPSCTFISSSAFASCSSLAYISIPLCERLEQNVFQNCIITSIDLPVCSFIHDYVFIGCNSLSQVSLPVCEYIGFMTFQNCWSLTVVDLPVCSTISACAFQYCSSLSQIYLRSNSVCRLISTNAFQYTPMSYMGTNNGSIFVPASLVDAYKAANNWSAYASHIYPIPEPTPVYSGPYAAWTPTSGLDDSEPGEDPWTFTVFYGPIDDPTGEDYVGIESCGGYYSDASMTAMNFNGLSIETFETNISGYVELNGCASLESVSLPNITYITAENFAGCENLYEMELPAVEAVDYWAFYGVSLTSLSLPVCSQIGNNAFGSEDEENNGYVESLYLYSSEVVTFEDFSTTCEGYVGMIYVPSGLYYDYLEAYGYEYESMFSVVGGIPEPPEPDEPDEPEEPEEDE